MQTRTEGKPMSKLYKRNGIYYVRFKQNGQVKWRSLKTRDTRDARAIRARLDRALRAERLFKNAPPIPANLSFERLFEYYTAWAEKRRRRGTIVQTKTELERFTKFTGLQYIINITRRQVIDYQQQYANTGAAPRTVNKSLRTLRAAVNVAIKLELYDRPNPFANFEPLPIQKSIPRWLSKEEMHTVLREAEQHSRDAHLIFALGIYAGLRKEEIIAARWDWIDFKNRTLYVRGSETFTIKDKEERGIDLGSTLTSILKQYDTNEAGYIVRPENEPGVNRYRFELRKTFDAVTRKAGVEWCTPKLLRYTFASQLVSNGAPLYYVQRQLGHSSPQTTMIYAHLAPNKDMIELIPAPPAERDELDEVEETTTGREKNPQNQNRAHGANAPRPRSKSPAPTLRE